MKQTRRGFLARIAAAAAAVAVAPKVAEAAPEQSSGGCQICQVNVVDLREHLAREHPLTWARVRELTGEERASGYALLMEQYQRGLVTREQFFGQFPELRMRDEDNEARAEGYERGRAVAEARQESRGRFGYLSSDLRQHSVARSGLESPYAGQVGFYGAKPISLTFATMVADCEARGCSLTHTVFPSYPLMAYQHDGTLGPLENPFLDGHLARVDAWRRGLHADSVN